MPIVRIELFRGRTRDQKAKAASEITSAIHQTLGAPPESTQIIFIDVEKEDWAYAGKLFDARGK